ncbi:MAG: hypothetical protein OHK0041_07340 [Anaerolineales bacterium]
MTDQFFQSFGSRVGRGAGAVGIGRGAGRGGGVTDGSGKGVGAGADAVTVKAGTGAGVLLPLQAASRMTGNKTIQRLIHSSISMKVNGI